MKLLRISVCSVVSALLLAGSGCSLSRMATRAMADALTGPGNSSVFTGDNDPQLVADAIPFAIKMYESLLAGSPDHGGLILTTGSLFVMYANAFVQGPAEFLPAPRYEERLAAQERAKKLYLRGADILRNGLERKYPGIGSASAEGGGLAPYLAKMKKEDVPLLYWIAAGTLSAFSLDPFDYVLARRVPESMAYAGRAYELDPDFNSGALDDFYILAYGSLPPAMGGAPDRAPLHFERALEKSGGKLAGPYVSYAQAVAIPADDYETFRSCLRKALDIDADADRENRLVNILAQRKARTLLDRAGEYFFLTEDGELDTEAYETISYDEDEYYYDEGEYYSEGEYHEEPDESEAF
ncbi:MAG: TRAP transporter TatT component family protein [Treponema sp.]|jgi:predicted anti-sigma-YlaC factor YlaD|nr:TRAP transporter TatT component family protein [Treponema sp.]